MHSVNVSGADVVKITVHKTAGLDMGDIDMSVLFEGTSYVGNSKVYTIGYGDGFRDQFRGTGFDYDFNATPIAGTVTTYIGYRNSTQLVLVEGMSVAATAIVKAGSTASLTDDRALVNRILAGADMIYGGDLQDNVGGRGGNDTVNGYGGHDILAGDGGNDRLNGGTGADKLTGGAGTDTLTGGSGGDQFIFKAISDSTVAAGGRDTILDFVASQGDKINLSMIDANSRVGGNQAFSFIGDDGFSRKAGELRFVKGASDSYVYGDVTGDGRADFAIHFDDSLAFGKGAFLL